MEQQLEVFGNCVRSSEIINVNSLVPKGHKLSHFNTEPCVLCCSKSLPIHQPWLELSCTDLQECTKNSLALAASCCACEECLRADNPVHPLPRMEDGGGKGGKAKSQGPCAGVVSTWSCPSGCRNSWRSRAQGLEALRALRLQERGLG